MSRAYYAVLGVSFDALPSAERTTIQPGNLHGRTWELYGLSSTVACPRSGTSGFDGAIARKGIPVPVQAGARWIDERTHQWMNGYGKLRRCTEKLRPVIDLYLFLAATLVVIRQLIQCARLRYRWDARPTAPRLK